MISSGVGDDPGLQLITQSVRPFVYGSLQAHSDGVSVRIKAQSSTRGHGDGSAFGLRWEIFGKGTDLVTQIKRQTVSV